MLARALARINQQGLNARGPNAAVVQAGMAAMCSARSPLPCGSVPAPAGSSLCAGQAASTSPRGTQPSAHPRMLTRSCWMPLTGFGLFYDLFFPSCFCVASLPVQSFERRGGGGRAAPNSSHRCLNPKSDVQAGTSQQLRAHFTAFPGT